MVKYKLFDNESLWNEKIIKYANFNPYQLFEWGIYKKQMNWKVASIEANNNGDLAYLQITYKKKFGFFIGWCVGSIAGNIDLFSKKELLDFIKSEFLVNHVFIKSSFTNELLFSESISLYQSGWNKSRYKLNSDYTIFLNLEKDMNSLISNCSSNFRKNLKRGESKNTNIKIGKLSDFNESEIFNLFERFSQIKNVGLPNIDELKLIKSTLSNNIIVATSFIDGNIVGLRAFLYHNNKALDFWAATDEIGRKNYTSFSLLFKLIEKAKELNIKTYDMSGVDPLNNKSVYSFKNGLRGELVEKLGEWEITNSKILSFLINRVYL